jgi:FkbM family methyltransferase
MKNEMKKIKRIIRKVYWKTVSVIGQRSIIHIEKKDNRSTNIFVNKSGSVDVSFEEKAIKNLIQNLRDDDTFYDIGANFGRYSCLVGEVRPGVRILAFEPNHEVASLLRENLRWNRVNTDVDVFEYALSNREGKTSLDIQEGAERARIQAESRATSDSIEVQMITLDDLLEQESLPPPSVIKIDVEGAELKVIEGMDTTLKDDHLRLLYCEVHPYLMQKMGDEEESIFAKLNQAGFEVEVIDQRVVQYADGEEEVQKFVRARRKTDGPSKLS